MNKIVLEHYPVNRLPDDIRTAIGNSGSVTLTIERDGPSPIDRDELVAQLRTQKATMQPGEGPTLDQVTEEIRTQRDQWDR